MVDSTAGGWQNLASWWLRMILRMLNFGFGVSLGLVGFPVGWVWDTETSERWRWDVDGVQCELFLFFVVVAGGTWCCFFGPTIFAKDLICPTSRGQRQADYTPQVILKWSHNGLVFQRHPCEFKWPTHIFSHNPQEKKADRPPWKPMELLMLFAEFTVSAFVNIACIG